eukprot:403334902
MDQQKQYGSKPTSHSESTRGGYRGRGGRGGAHYSNQEGSERSYNNYDRQGGSGNSVYKGDDSYKSDGQRGGYRGGYRGGRGRGGTDNYHQSDRNDQGSHQKQTTQPSTTQNQPTKQEVKKTTKGLFSSDFDLAFGPKTTNPPPDSTKEVNITTSPSTDTQPQEAPADVQTPQNEEEKVIQQTQGSSQVKENTDSQVKTTTNGHQVDNQHHHQNGKGQHYHQGGYDKQQHYDRNNYKNDRSKQYDGRFKNYQEKRDFYKKNAQQEEQKKEEDKKEQENGTTPASTEVETTKQEEVKKPERVPFVPDPNFSWSLDLEGTLNKGKKKKRQADAMETAFVIQSKMAKAELKENIKMKLAENLEFSTIHIDKLNKGLTNTTNCCFMNVILQSLLSIPAFFNMLVAISDNQEVMKELGPDSLLRKFVYLSMYFNPMLQMDRKSPFAANPVDAEKIFAELNQNFNPHQEHQDCHEFLAMLLDLLHDELKLIYVPPDVKDKEAVVDEWQEVGNKNSKCKFNNDQQQISQSLINDIFGGIVRNEFQIDRSTNVSVTFEPFFFLNLEVNRSESLEECLNNFFRSKIINDYKLEGKIVRATHQQQIEKLPNILILQLKRFVYRDGPVKIGEFIEFPEVLRIEDNCLSTHLKLGTFNKEERDKNGRSYRLTSIGIHKGTQLSRGHYICYVLDASNNWIQYDDNKIKKMIDTDTVFDSQAYLLFYELII